MADPVDAIQKPAGINNEPKSKSRWIIILGTILLILLIAIGGGYYLYQSNHNTAKQSSDSAKTSVATPSATSSSWQSGGVAVAGKYADAEAVNLGDGRFRLYYAVEPEVTGNNLEIYSSISSDGINWTKEDGARKTMATFPDVIKLPDGKWRMYFQNAGVIKSALSSDGLLWSDEIGTRINKTESGFNLESVGAQSTTRLADNTYVMVYRGTINEAYQSSEKLPNNNTQLYFWATSTDGLTFTKKGVAIDSRNETLYGLSDGAEWVKWNSGQYRLYFWSYKGIYHADYQNEIFATPEFDWTNNTNSQVKFAPDPPGDPTFLKISNVWYMYYGQHTKGIYYATLKVN